MSRLYTKFKDEIKQKQKDLHPERNSMEMPVLKKVVINCRIPDAGTNKDSLEVATKEISVITGQTPTVTSAKKSEANFKIRKGDPLALKVTLRGTNMYDFIEKLFNIVLPRLRDFKGLKTSSFVGSGNYNMTIRDQTYFPEIDLNKISQIRTIQITLVTSTSSQDRAKMLLSALGLPFEK